MDPATEEIKTEESTTFDKSSYLTGRHEKEVQEASSRGWTDIDAYMDKGGNADDWFSAEVFNANGRSINNSRKQKSNSGQELKKALQGVNEFHATQLEMKNAEITAMKEEAIKDGDVDKVAELDKSLDQNKVSMNKIKQSANEALMVPAEYIEHEKNWADKNKWSTEKTPKGAYAREAAIDGLNANLHGEDLTNYIESEVAREFPEKNPNRENASISNKGGKNARSSEALTMGSLTSEESKIAQAMMNQGKGYTEEDVLKMVKSSRG